MYFPRDSIPLLVAPRSDAPTPQGVRLGLAAFTSLAALTAGLGTWQMQRRQWKIDLIDQYKARFDSDPIPLSQSVFYSGADPEQELRRVALPDDAVFLHDKSYLLGPRVSPKQDASHTTGAMPSTGIGYFVITPLKCADGKVVLVNRGWIPKPSKGESPSIDKIEVPKGGVAVARNGEQMSSYLATGYDQRSNTFLAMDLPMMLNKMELLSAQTAASPSADMFLEMFEPANPLFQRRQAVNFFSGGAMSVSPDKHLLYAATWFSFTATILIGSFVRFRKHLPLLRG